jgi:hypothetical protein
VMKVSIGPSGVAMSTNRSFMTYLRAENAYLESVETYLNAPGVKGASLTPTTIVAWRAGLATSFVGTLHSCGIHVSDHKPFLAR